MERHFVNGKTLQIERHLQYIVDWLKHITYHTYTCTQTLTGDQTVYKIFGLNGYVRYSFCSNFEDISKV